MIDFERALRNSCDNNFTERSSAGCLFHFCQTVYRKICQLGYKVRYGTDGCFATKIKMFRALAFLPPDDVIDTYEDLCEDESVPIEFISYFVLIYIRPKRGRRDQPLYPFNFWNVHNRVIQDLPRTNNAFEGFHSHCAHQLQASTQTFGSLLKLFEKKNSSHKPKLFKLREEIIYKRRENTRQLIRGLKIL